MCRRRELRRAGESDLGLSFRVERGDMSLDGLEALVDFLAVDTDLRRRPRLPHFGVDGILESVRKKSFVVVPIFDALLAKLLVVRFQFRERVLVNIGERLAGFPGFRSADELVESYTDLVDERAGFGAELLENERDQAAERDEVLRNRLGSGDEIVETGSLGREAFRQLRRDCLHRREELFRQLQRGAFSRGLDLVESLLEMVRGLGRLPVDDESELLCGIDEGLDPVAALQ